MAAAHVPDRDEVVITADPLPLGHLASRVVCPTAGAIATFIGTTRDHFEGKQVVRLEVRACALQQQAQNTGACFCTNAGSDKLSHRILTARLLACSTKRTRRWPNGRCASSSRRHANVGSCGTSQSRTALASCRRRNRVSRSRYRARIAKRHSLPSNSPSTSLKRRYAQTHTRTCAWPPQSRSPLAPSRASRVRYDGACAGAHLEERDLRGQRR